MYLRNFWPHAIRGGTAGDVDVDDTLRASIPVPSFVSEVSVVSVSRKIDSLVPGLPPGESGRARAPRLLLSSSFSPPRIQVTRALPSPK